MSLKRDTLYLIDGSSYIFRAYHATGGLSTSKGFPTGAVFGFTNMLIKTLKDRSPERIAVIFDERGPTFRHKQYPEYKANRPPMPEDLAEQIPVIHSIVAAYSIPSLSKPGFEADDIIATLTREAASSGWDVVIVSADKDLMQLVEPGVVMWDPQSNKEYDPEAVKKKWGVPPDQIRDFLALMGDSSDNIPGVAGVGKKTAAALMEQFGSLENIYANLEEVSQKRAKKNLSEHKDEALLSRDLVKLDDRVELETTLEQLKPGEEDNVRLKELFKELEFSRLLSELPPDRSLDFSRYRTVVTLEELEQWIERIKASPVFAVDLETTSTEPVRAELVGISLCVADGEACYIPVAHESGEQLGKEEVLRRLGPVLTDERLKKIGQNIKYDMIVLQKEGIEVRGVTCDTMIASYLLDPGRRSHKLDDLAQTFLDHRMIPIKDLIGTGKKQILFSQVEIAEGAEYACEDADVTFRIASILTPQLEAQGLNELFRDLELPLIPILRDMEMAGVRVDPFYLNDLSDEFGSMLRRTEAEIYELAGEEFNINSTKQLGVILFDKIGLTPIKKTKTGFSTSLDVLEALATEHDLPRKILDYRSIFKLKSTYVDALAGLVNPVTGRIHTSYNQAVAATGRLSSSDPNLQNIPVRTAEGRKIRKAFIPDEGHLFVAADYSQIELRVMAHLSQDSRLREAFGTGEDVHAITAASVFDCSPAHVTPDMRRKAKAINFGIMYGMGAFRLAGQIGVGLKLAEKYLEDYYRTYAGVRKYMDEVPEIAAEQGYVSTLMGRRRYLPDLKSKNRIAQRAARRVAVNTTIQGTAADLIKLAMIRVDRALREEKMPARMILQVHDELILEVRQEAAEEAAELLRSQMEGVYKLSVPLVVDTATGRNWDEAH